MRFFVVVTLLLLAHTVSAQVVITEVMYDPEGADTGYEWIEIENRGNASVAIEEGKSGWKFFEDGTHHTLVRVRGETTLGVGAIGIIADNADNFLATNPSFNGTLFDSSFSLKNTGETLVLKNSDGVEESSVLYEPTHGAQGDGNSLQEKGGVWVAASPTPGMRASGGNGVPLPQENVTGGGGGGSSSPSIPRGIPTLSLRAKSTVAIVGAPFTFEPRVRGSEEGEYYQWSFGDGATSMIWGAQPISHTYYYPGTYTVFLEAPNLNLSTKLSVRAVVPEVSLTTQGDRVHSSVTIENRGSEELDMEKWQLLSGGSTFIFPKLVVAPKQSVRLPSEVTRLTTPEGGYVELRFPSGVRVPVVENTPIMQEVASSTVVSFSNISVKKASVYAPAQVAPLIPVAPLVEEDAPEASPSVQTATLLAGEEDHLWQWYTGAAFIALFALLGLRFVRSRQTPADEYEIIEDNDEM